jgi:transaldolase
MSLPKIQIFLDTADIKEINAIGPVVSGFTTNPSLMRRAGVTDYLSFARDLAQSTDKPISLEVLSDDFHEMERQAKILASIKSNVFVKIPIGNSLGHSSLRTIHALSSAGVPLNITALFTVEQTLDALRVLDTSRVNYLSVFAGRIADTGRDPESIIQDILAYRNNAGLFSQKILWASTREVLNIFQAARCGCDVITLTPEYVKKLDLIDLDLIEFSRQTSEMFLNDAIAGGYTL